MGAIENVIFVFDEKGGSYSREKYQIKSMFNSMDKLELCIEKIKTLLGIVLNDGNPDMEDKYFCYTMLAKCYQKLNNNNEMVRYNKLALQCVTNEKEYVGVALELAKFYQKSNPKKSNKYYKRCIKMYKNSTGKYFNVIYTKMIVSNKYKFENIEKNYKDILPYYLLKYWN